jgi:hypothetical protein
MKELLEGVLVCIASIIVFIPLCIIGLMYGIGFSLYMSYIYRRTFFKT